MRRYSGADESSSVTSERSKTHSPAPTRSVTREPLVRVIWPRNVWPFFSSTIVSVFGPGVAPLRSLPEGGSGFLRPGSTGAAAVGSGRGGVRSTSGKAATGGSGSGGSGSGGSGSGCGASTGAGSTAATGSGSTGLVGAGFGGFVRVAVSSDGSDSMRSPNVNHAVAPSPANSSAAAATMILRRPDRTNGTTGASASSGCASLSTGGAPSATGAAAAGDMARAVSLSDFAKAGSSLSSPEYQLGTLFDAGAAAAGSACAGSGAWDEAYAGSASTCSGATSAGGGGGAAARAGSPTPTPASSSTRIHSSLLAALGAGEPSSAIGAGEVSSSTSSRKLSSGRKPSGVEGRGAAPSRGAPPDSSSSSSASS